MAGPLPPKKQFTLNFTFAPRRSGQAIGASPQSAPPESIRGKHPCGLDCLYPCPECSELASLQGHFGGVSHLAFVKVRPNENPKRNWGKQIPMLRLG